MWFPSRRALVLASASPRRVALLREVGATFTVMDPGPDRAWPGSAEPRHGVRALALDKARRVASRRKGAVVIGADTVVVARGSRLGKPSDPGEARAMMRRLQGRVHEVWSGIAVVRDEEQRTAAECTRVQFGKLSESEIAAYVALGESLDKAGGYGIQGAAAQFVTRIDGDWTNVVGLPLARLRRVLAEFV
ncbi:MAG: septum formation protein Maf [Candidatus Eisenbacteria bacterium]|nr:septum formation protein Maf [Candidatus Eisenbacteria bacterium]